MRNKKLLIGCSPRTAGKTFTYSEFLKNKPDGVVSQKLIDGEKVYLFWNNQDTLVIDVEDEKGHIYRTVYITHLKDKVNKVLIDELDTQMSMEFCNKEHRQTTGKKLGYNCIMCEDLEFHKVIKPSDQDKFDFDLVSKSLSKLYWLWSLVYWGPVCSQPLLTWVNDTIKQILFEYDNINLIEQYQEFLC